MRIIQSMALILMVTQGIHASESEVNGEGKKELTNYPSRDRREKRVKAIIEIKHKRLGKEKKDSDNPARRLKHLREKAFLRSPSDMPLESIDLTAEVHNLKKLSDHYKSGVQLVTCQRPSSYHSFSQGSVSPEGETVQKDPCCKEYCSCCACPAYFSCVIV